MKKHKQNVTPAISLPRRPPMLRSAAWALFIGALGGGGVGVVQTYLLNSGLVWGVAGGVLGLLLGLVVGGDLLLPGPPKRHLGEAHTDRVGPFRAGVLLLLLLVQGLFFSGYLWGTVTLTCERLAMQGAPTMQIDCRRTTYGWGNSRQTGETLYEHVIGGGLDIRDELLLQHGPYAQSQSVSGFSAAALPRVQAWLRAPTAALTLVADGWTIRLGAPVCLVLALLAGGWAFFSLRRGFYTLREQFALGEVYWGWRAP